MNKIRIWKLALLTFVTFGIYGLYWFSRTRNELVADHKQQVPHWLWLVLPLILALVLIFPTMIVLMMGGLALNIQPSDIVLAFYVIPLVIIGIPLTIGAWWMWHFGKAVSAVTHGRIPAGWTLALYIFIGPYVSLFQQYYLNRIETYADEDPSKKVRPSSKFLTCASIVIGISCGLSIVSFSSMPQDFKDAENSINEIDNYNKRIDEYAAKYKACIADLDKAYPEVTEENEPEYLKGYNACEQIRLDQEKFIKG